MFHFDDYDREDQTSGNEKRKQKDSPPIDGHFSHSTGRDDYLSGTAGDEHEGYDDDDDDHYETDKEAFKFRKTQKDTQDNVIEIDAEEDNEIIVSIGNVDFVTPNANGSAAAAASSSLSSKTAAAGLKSSIGSGPPPARKVGKLDFSLLKVIGKGAFGKVFLVQKSTGSDAGHYYAMKVLKKAHIVLHAKDTEHTKTERQILEEVRHPFIVRLFYAFQTDSKLYLILDYAPGGELFMYLEKQKMLLEDVAMFYMAELVLALEHLHKLGIFYRDLKPENVLLDEVGHVKLTDFGLSKVSISDEKANSICGTVEYMAPEILANVAYDKTCDWWSLGALSFDMLTGSPPFTSNNRKKTVDMILNKKLSLPYFLTVDAKDLLTKLLRKTAAVRLGSQGADDIKKHRFFKPIKWDKLLKRELVPPFKPNITAADDTTNFSNAFTNMPVVDSPVDHDNVLHSVNANDVFKGFSFVSNSVLNENFGALYLRRPNLNK